MALQRLKIENETTELIEKALQEFNQGTLTLQESNVKIQEAEAIKADRLLISDAQSSSKRTWNLPVDLDQTPVKSGQSSADKRKWAIIKSLKAQEPPTKKIKLEFTECYRCGSKQHKANNPNCQAKNHFCTICDKTGHYETSCKSIDMSDYELLQHVESMETIITEEELNTMAADIIKEAGLDQPLQIEQEGAYVITSEENENLWTFIYKGKKPSFINYKGDVLIINHLDHYHFVFKSVQRVKKRSITRIFNGGNMDMTQLEKGLMTCQPVINWENYKAYLVRKYNDVQLIGTKLQTLYIDLMSCTDTTKDCMELNRTLRQKKNTYMPAVKREQKTNYLMDLITQYDTRHVEELKQHLSADQRLDLYHEFGTQWNEAAKLCIEIYNEKLKKIQESTLFEDHIQSNNHKHKCEEPTKTTDIDYACAWFDQLLEVNKINKTEFLQAVTDVMNKKYTRRNTLCIEGPTTTGKTLLLNLIASNYNYGTVQRSGDHSQFFLQNLIKKTLALMEEPRITPITVNDFKELLGGQVLDIHVKHQDDVRLQRIPVLISTNHNLGMYINSIDRDAIYKRTFTFEFNSEIGVLIEEPKIIFCACHFGHWYGRWQKETRNGN